MTFLLILVMTACNKAPLTEVLASDPPSTKSIKGLPSESPQASTVKIPDGTVSPEPTAQPGWQNYRNEALGLRLHYPSGWTLEEGTGVVTIKPSDPEDQASLSLALYQGDVTAQTLVETIINKRKERFPDLKPFEPEPFMLAGIQGVTLDYTFTGEGGVLIYESVIAISNEGEGYAVNLSAKQEEYEGMLQYFNPILQSFRLDSPDAKQVEAQLAKDILSPEVAWQKYENKRLGLTILYPKNWIVSETEAAVYFTGPDAILKPFFYIKVALDSLSSQQFVEAILQTRVNEYADLKFSGSRAFALGGVGVVTADYAYTDREGVFVHESVRAATVGKRTYAIQFGARNDVYDLALEIFRPMIDSLQLSP